MEAQLLVNELLKFIAANGPTAPVLTCDGFMYSGFVASFDQVKGAMVLDVFPEEMTAPLVNRYLEIKARHLL